MGEYYILNIIAKILVLYNLGQSVVMKRMKRKNLGNQEIDNPRSVGLRLEVSIKSITFTSTKDPIARTKGTKCHEEELVF